MFFKTAATERLRISSAGLVGIGTDNPSKQLDISGGGLIVQSDDISSVFVLKSNMIFPGPYLQPGVPSEALELALLFKAPNQLNMIKYPYIGDPSDRRRCALAPRPRGCAG